MFAHDSHFVVLQVISFCRQLRDGTLKDNGLMDGSRIILLPSVETGLLVSLAWFGDGDGLSFS